MNDDDRFDHPNFQERYEQQIEAYEEEKQAKAAERQKRLEPPINLATRHRTCPLRPVASAFAGGGRHRPLHRPPYPVAVATSTVGAGWRRVLMPATSSTLRCHGRVA